MDDLKLGVVESKFADIIWQNEPLHSRELVKLCEAELHWKKPTTYTVLRKLCERGIFQNVDGMVTSVISKEEAQQSELDEMMDKKFEGSLPASIAAFGRRQELSEAEIAEIRRIIER